MRLGLVYLTVIIIAACGLGYELVAGALSSYLLGDSVTQFSLTIGLYLFAMGIGAWLSRYVQRNLVSRFVDIELAVALAGGTSAMVLHLAHGRGIWFRPVLYGEIVLIGTLVGLEIPLLMRILKDELDFRELVAQVLSLDYVGALVVSLSFPLLFVPNLGVVKSAIAFGLVNAAVGLWSTWIFAQRLGAVGWLRAKSLAVIGVLAACLWGADAFTGRLEGLMYGDEVVLTKSTPYQRIVVTSNERGFQLYLNGALQFASADEYRYHEALVHPAFVARPQARRVLVLGGGDGLAVREILKHPQVERVTLVDIDPEMTRLAREYEPLVTLNARALHDPRVELVHEDALGWLATRRGLHDIAIVDFPDPSHYAIGKLYTAAFYQRLTDNLAPDGVMAIQSTSPLFARRAFWCIVRTVESAQLTALPYHVFLPSFGEWGFVLAARQQLSVPKAANGELISGLRYLDGPTLSALFHLGPDMQPVPVEPNRLDEQRLVRYYEEDWRELD